MTAICTCKNAIVNRTKHKDPYCERCGDWWDKRYGSTDPVPPSGHKIQPEQKIKAPKIGRNDRCPCGSGKKYKRCCLLKRWTEEK